MAKGRWFLLALAVVACGASGGLNDWGPQDVVNVAVGGALLPVVEPKVAGKQPKYDPSASAHFDPENSLSFARVLYEVFDLTYADGSELKGYVGHDVVQLGEYHAETKFGCITHCEDPHFNGVDGILGLGLPAAADKSVPQPLFFALTDLFGGHYANDRILKSPKFAIFSSDSGAELQLGGLDPNCVDADMIYMKSTSLAEYSLEVESLSFGGIELLEFNPMVGKKSLPAILDSGTSCLVIPNSTFAGHLMDSPYSKFKSVERKGLSFYITVQGHIFEIPFRHWWRKAINSACVQPTPKNFNGLLLGDVVFRSLVVEFDLTHAHAPLIGLAPPNPDYVPLPPGEPQGTKVPMLKHSSHGIVFQTPRRSRGLNKVPVMVDVAETVYFVNVSMGTPRQTFTVFMDTGSSVLAVFCKPPPDNGNIHMPGGLHLGGISLPKSVVSAKTKARLRRKLRDKLKRRRDHMRRVRPFVPPKFLQTAVSVQATWSSPLQAALALAVAGALFGVALFRYRRTALARQVDSALI